MRLSFDDEGSFKEAVESLRFNRSDPNACQQFGSSNCMPLEDFERSEDYSDPIPLRRVGSSSSLSIQVVKDMGNPWVNLGVSLPLPVNTRTHGCGYGFPRVLARVWIRVQNPWVRVQIFFKKYCSY